MENLPEGSLTLIAIFAVALLFLAIVGRNILNRQPKEEEDQGSAESESDEVEADDRPS